MDELYENTLMALFCHERGLIVGQVNRTVFCVLAELARIRNIRILRALEAHLVHGWPREKACSMYGVNVTYFSRRLSALNHVWQLTEILKVAGGACGDGKENIPEEDGNKGENYAMPETK